MKIEMKDIYKSFGKNDVLKGVDFTLNDGEIHALVGENGAGKTTIFNLISKLYTDYEGEILINGKEIRNYKDEDLRNEVLFIESKPFILRENLNPNITLFGKNEIDELFLDKIIRFLELEKIKTHKTKNLEDTLSKGEQQKIQLARLLISKQPLILLDEALSGLDKEMKKKVISIIKERSKDKIIVIISHDHEIQKVCNEIILMPDKNSLIKNKNIHKS
ncbi:MAG: ABC transporter ATP-binding protein [Anaerococcus sp.]|nr:ABC transporter ATP-binding protein [Anaerococcus sp.]